MGTMRANLVMLGLLGAVSLTQGFFLGLTDLCCGAVEAQCRTDCNTRECGSQCSGQYGMFRRRCGPYTCSSSTSSPTTTTTTACNFSSTCVGGSAGCSSGLTCYDGTNLLNTNCCGRPANYCLTQAANNPSNIINCP